MNRINKNVSETRPFEFLLCYILKGKRNAYFTFWYCISMKLRCMLNISFDCFNEYWQEVHRWKNHSTMKRQCFNKAWDFGKNFEASVHVLQFEIFVDHFLIIDIYVQKFRILFVLTSICYVQLMPHLNERQRGEEIQVKIKFLSLNDFTFHSQPYLVLDVGCWQQEV
jgi:hypothetical protein